MNFKPLVIALCVASIGALTAWSTSAQTVPEAAAIRKGLNERLSGVPKIDEVNRSPVQGLFEVRIGNEVFYTDADASYLVRGEIIDLKTKRNLTEERMTKLSAIDFASLPLKDAVVWKSGTGARKIAVFADPNCGYCKRFEKELLGVKDVTVYTFLAADPGRRFARQGQRDLVREGPDRRVAQLDGRWRAAAQAAGCVRVVADRAQPRTQPQAPRERHAGHRLRRRRPGAGHAQRRAARKAARSVQRQVLTPRPRAAETRLWAVA